MITTQLNSISAANYLSQDNIQQNKSSRIQGCALSAITPLPAANKMSSHTFPIVNWVFEVEGKQFTLMMKDGKLAAKPFTIEHQEREYSGLMAGSLSQAIDSVKSGARDFCLVAKESNLNYTHSIVFMHEGKVMTRDLNFTQFGDKNSNPIVHHNISDFYAHTVRYASRHGVTV